MPLTQDAKKKLVQFQQEPTWQEEIDLVKQQLLDLSKVELAERLRATKELKEGHEREVHQLNTILEAVNQLMVPILEEEGISSFKLPDGYTFFVNVDARVKVLDKTAYHAWIREKGLVEFFDIHSSRTASLAKEALMQGEELPGGLEAYYQSSIRFRKPTTAKL